MTDTKRGKECSGVIWMDDPNPDRSDILRCKHGHDTNSACIGILSTIIIPTCKSEKNLYDENSKTMTLLKWRGE